MLISSKLLSTSLPIRVNPMIFFHSTYIMIEIFCPTVLLLIHSCFIVPSTVSGTQLVLNE